MISIMLKIISILTALTISSFAKPYSLHKVVKADTPNSTKHNFENKVIWLSDEVIISS